MAIKNNSAPIKKSRVVMVASCPFPANHGTPAAIRLLAINLAEMGHEVHVLSYPQGQDDLSTKGLHMHRVSVPFMAPGGIAIGPSYERLLYDFLMIFKLISVIKKHKIEIIHAHNYEATMASVFAKWLTGIPLIYTGVNSMIDELASYDFIKPKKLADWLGKFLDYIVPRAGDIVMTLSDELKEYLLSLGMRENKMIVIPPGVEVEMFDQANPQRIRDLYQLQDNPVVMYTGAMEAFQRIDYLLLAMQEVVQSFPDAKLMMVGNITNSAASQKYKTMARELGIDENIIFIDSVPLKQLPDYLSVANVAVVPRPNCPGYPIKLLNYMAAGKAIVTFKGSAKAIYHGYNGYIAEDHDVSGLAEGIKTLMADKKLQRVLGKRAKESISGVFDWQTLAKGTEQLYSILIRDKGQLNNKHEMGEYIKGSYVPRLSSNAEKNKGFLQKGPILFPSFNDIEKDLVQEN